MKIFPTEYQFTFEKNPSRLLSLWYTLYIGVYTFFLCVLWRALVLRLVLAVGIALRDFARVFKGWWLIPGYGLMGHLSARQMTSFDFVMWHMSFAESIAKRKAEKGDAQ